MAASQFHIINASAGSGKTFSLVLHYLKHLLESYQTDAFKKLLALTFTNKAVNEMKERILNTLVVLSKNPEEQSVILEILCQDLNTTPEQLQKRAYDVLKHIINDYGAFDVITLDTFSHRIVRTFGKDLKLPYNFVVSVDALELLEQMVDVMVDAAGHDRELTQILMQLNLYKVKEGRSWNIKEDLLALAKMLLEEKDRTPIQSLKQKPKHAFMDENAFLENLKEALEQQMKEKALSVLELLKERGLVKEDFNRGTLYNHFKKVSDLNYARLYDNQLGLALAGEKPLYSKTIAAEKQEAIEEIRELLTERFERIQKQYYQMILSNQLLKHRTPLALLKLMDKTLKGIEKQEKKVLLARFNEMITEIVLNDPAPYIYERLGERYRHYFVDEFQDTSQLQWSNLIPLVANALESETLEGERGSLLLVGDPKQAIYRWRGGYVEQFLKLMSGEKGLPFQVPPTVTFLPKNFRSLDTVVTFNNTFFKTCGMLLENKIHQELFTLQSQQERNGKKGGYVSITTILKMTKEFSEPLYAQKTIETIESLITQGFAQNEIAVLVRKKEQVTILGSALTAAGYKILSSESLTLESSPAIQFLIALFSLKKYPNEALQHKVVLDFLWEQKDWEGDYHEFISAHVHLYSDKLFEAISEQLELEFSFRVFQKLPLYEMAEYAINTFPFINGGSAHMLQFLELVFQFSKEKTPTVQQFLEYWEARAKTFYVTAPEGMDAIKIMTVHKSKGLEFPVVILPFLDDAFQMNTEKVWFPLLEAPFKNMGWGWINFSEAIGAFGESGAAFLKSHKQSNILDAFNLLYVAMTRAAMHLHIITSKSNSEKVKSYADLFAHFLKNNGFDYEGQEEFEWGKKGNKSAQNGSKKEEEHFFNVILPTKDHFNWKKRLVVSSTSTQEPLSEAQDFGVFIHEILRRIRGADEAEVIIQEAFENQELESDQQAKIKSLLLEVVHHPVLKPFFTGKGFVFCEKDILVPEKKDLRPDRVVKQGDLWAVMDYKTGKPKESHREQIKEYAQVLVEMGAKNIEMYLVYVLENVQVLRI